MYEQIFVLLFLILGNKTFVESRCAKVSTHEDIITVEMCVQRKPMHNQNFTHGSHGKNEHFWPFGGPGCRGFNIQTGPFLVHFYALITGIIGNMHTECTLLFTDMQRHICQSMVVKDQEHVTVVVWLMYMISICDNIWPLGGAGWGGGGPNVGIQ